MADQPGRRSSRLTGHGLQHEGKAFVRCPTRPSDWIRNYSSDRTGVALCECGAVSDVLGSDSARKRWHQGHKEAVRSG